MEVLQGQVNLHHQHHGLPGGPIVEVLQDVCGFVGEECLHNHTHTHKQLSNLGMAAHTTMEGQLCKEQNKIINFKLTYF